MKMLVYIDEYVTVQFDKELSELMVEWRKSSARLSFKNIANRFMLVGEIIKKYKPKYVFSNFEDMVYKQIYGVESLFYHKIHALMLNAGVEKFAYIKSKDKITEILFDQLLHNSELKKVKMKNFETKSDAEKWLIKEKTLNKFKKSYAISA